MPPIAVITWLLLPSPCAQDLTLEIVETPAAKSSLAPNLAPMGDDFVLSWIDRLGKRQASVQCASWNGKAFDAPHTVATSKQMFANWADIPAVIEAPSGDLYAHWLERISSETYAYGIRLMRSTDRGKSFKQIGWLHDDDSPTEHGFVSFISEGKLVRAFWLDGRAMEKGGKMMLRTAVIDGDEVRGERVLDDDVCTCCPTSAVQLAAGPAVVYRDRSTEEIRDIGITRRVGANWTNPTIVGADNWYFPGCPVNGPSIASHADLVAVSRYTILDDKAHVLLTLSDDSGVKFGLDIALDENKPIGRCVTVCTEAAVYVLWICKSAKGAALQLAQVSRDGVIEHRTTLTQIDGGRSSGSPRLISTEGHLWVTWTDKRRVRLGRVKIGR